MFVAGKEQLITTIIHNSYIVLESEDETSVQWSIYDGHNTR